MKKLVSIILALAMIGALSTTAFAAEETTYTLTITGATGHTYDVYQIFTGDIAHEGGKTVLSNVKYGLNHYPINGAVGDPVPADELEQLIGATKPADILDSAVKDTPFANDVTPEGDNTSIEIKNLTLANANIEGAGFNSTGLGAFVGAADACNSVILDNCHLVDSTITCTADVTGVGGIIGFSSSPLTMTNCSVTNTTVNGVKDSVCALIGHTYKATITNAKVVGCTLTGETDNKTGYVVGTVNADTTITTSADCAGNTVFGTADSTTVYGRIVGATLTLNGVTLP